jgi:hypothetical protein
LGAKFGGTCAKAEAGVKAKNAGREDGGNLGNHIPVGERLAFATMLDHVISFLMESSIGIFWSGSLTISTPS